jgi:hypothetical protein
MLMQEAFRRALDQLEQDHQEPNLDVRNLRIVHSAAPTTDPQSTLKVSDGEASKLVYAARKLARRWCNYARPGQDSACALNALRDEWLVLTRQIARLPDVQGVQLVWELARAMQPESTRHDADRFRYLTRRAAAHPELFVGLASSPHLPWPGPATFLVHAVEELEGASAEERADFHRLLGQQWEDRPFWFIEALSGWIRDRYQLESLLPDATHPIT